MPKSPTAEGPNFTPVKTLRTFEMICDQIRGELAAGSLKAGDKLPAERDLAVQLGVSRNALREALRSLEVAGIIRNAKGAKGGAFVKYADPERVTQAMEDYVNLGDITLDELTEARIAMQDVIIRLACQRASDVDLAELEVIAEKTQKVSDVETRYRYAVEYYTVLARATRNRVFGIFVDALSSILHKFVQGPGYETLQESLIQSRLALVRHLRARDADAAALEMRKHLERIHRHVRKNVKARAASSS